MLGAPMLAEIHDAPSMRRGFKRVAVLHDGHLTDHGVFRKVDGVDGLVALVEDIFRAQRRMIMVATNADAMKSSAGRRFR